MEASPQNTAWRNPAVMEELLSDGYSERLFFHPYQHALDTRAHARELGKWVAYEEAQKPLSQQRSVDFYALDWAALGHDYGYMAYTSLPDTVKQQYPSREKYAAAMTAGFMSQLGAPEDVITKVKEAIWSTEAGVGCTSLEGRILRQADLANVASQNPAVFFWNTVKLYREYRLLGGENPNLFFPREFASYCVKSHQLLNIYNAEDVSLGDFDMTADGKSLFCSYAGENIRWLLPDRVKHLAQMAGCSLLKELKGV